MTANHGRGGWDDNRIDRVLRQSLDVEPSPDLPVRIRTRIAAEPVPGASRLSLWIWAAGAVTAAAVLAVLQPGFRGTPPAPQRSAAIAAAAFPPVPYRAAVRQISTGYAAGPIAARPIVARPALAAGVGASADAATAEARPHWGAEAIFSPADRASFVRLFELARAGRLDVPETLPAAPVARAVVVSEIRIPVIEIPWLVMSSRREGEQQ